MHKSKAEALIKFFITAGIPIINVSKSEKGVFTEKIIFNDSRFYTKEEEPEFTIEVFDNEKKLKSRNEELQKISDQASVMFLKFYFISSNGVLLRLPYRLTLGALLEYRKTFELYEKADKNLWNNSDDFSNKGGERNGKDNSSSKVCIIICNKSGSITARG